MELAKLHDVLETRMGSGDLLNFANQFKRILSEQRIRAQCSLSTYL